LKLFVRFIFVFILTVLVLFLRRPDQFYAPYIWVEDGRNVLPEFARDGWISVLYPLNGYLVAAMRLLTVVSLKVSFLHFPHVSLALTILCTSGVVYAIAFAPTALRWKPLCAALVFLVPTDAEVFAIGEYVFWWLGLLLFLALIWDPGKSTVARSVMVAVAGLSCPTIVILAPLFAVRALVYRAIRSEIVVSGVAIVAAALQVAIMLTTKSTVSSATAFTPLKFAIVVRKFFGDYAVFGWPSAASTVYGLFVLTILLVSVKRLGFRNGLLVLSFLASIFAVVVRIPVEGIHPYLAGPRYYFYPYVLLAWALVWITATPGWAILRGAALTTTLLAVLLSVNKFARRDDQMSWGTHARECLAATSFEFPVAFDGVRKNAWQVPIEGALCRALAQGALF
jgi:hypothetical protein